jgi:predicted  nucleic acid-binding Zn-ribbon protein
MPTLKELSDKVDELQGALDTEQEQIKSAIDALTTANEELTALVAAGGTEEERQAVADKIAAVITDLQGTIA